MADAIDTLLHGTNAAYLEQLVRDYLADPEQVEPSWRRFFDGPGRELVTGPAAPAGPSFTPSSVFAAGPAAPAQAPAPFTAPTPGAPPPGIKPETVVKAQASAAAQASMAAGPSHDVLAAQVRIGQLIDAYRAHGHMKARLDPLGFFARPSPPQLDPEYWGFTAEDHARTYATVGLPGLERMTLADLVAFLDETYARTIGCEFMHMSDSAAVAWLQERVEATRNHRYLDRDTQRFLLRRLLEAEAFEQFLHVKFRGKKRFSLEGAEAMIPLLALLIEETARRGVEEIVLGMPHRGRLNVLVNILGKRYASIFHEFKDMDAAQLMGRGDVKYHMGFSADLTTRFGDDVHLSLTFNPSHLEFINPVVAGRVRAKQDRIGDVDRSRVLPLLLHGDAAFPGQGVVAETLNLMNLGGYATGGTIHLVVNNQIGFTTMPEDSRSSTYATDLAKGCEIPIFHVNGEDPEAVAQVVEKAADFRQRFHRDVIIDMYCFRRYGHNEADEPSFTQPVMYRAIARHPEVHAVYAKLLTEEGRLDPAEVDVMKAETQQRLEEELARSEDPADRDNGFEGIWKGYLGGRDADCPEVETAVPVETLERVMEAATSWPEGFQVNPKVRRLMTRRRELVAEGGPLDWGIAETLAYGSLVLEGFSVRISGQDSQRGTFSHRHAVLTDQANGSAWAPLAHVAEEQGRFEVYNSPLSEAGVLGFEFGYSLDSPEVLVIWEAQFGDFANGAQVLIDQFISATEDKWNRIAGLVMLLPHGFEGQGPEHSSARLERYLQSCAEDNIQVVYPTTPAQIFHLLRRQMVRKWRKPLVVMSPKSLLRHKLAVSQVSELAQGRFQRVIGEQLLADPTAASRAVLCTGKVYYDLLEHRDAIGDTSTALLRVEQLYPFPADELSEAIDALGALDEVVWCQEEPENMGAFTFMLPWLLHLFRVGPRLRFESREASASPATGSAKAHQLEQDELIARVFGEAPSRSGGAPRQPHPRENT